MIASHFAKEKCTIIDFFTGTAIVLSQEGRADSMPLNMQELGKRIVAAREQLGWSQRELVRVSRVGQNNLSVLEQGKKSSVRADTVVRLAEALGVSADYLLGLTDDPATPKRQRTRKTASVG